MVKLFIQKTYKTSVKTQNKQESPQRINKRYSKVVAYYYTKVVNSFSLCGQ